MFKAIIDLILGNNNKKSEVLHKSDIQRSLYDFNESKELFKNVNKTNKKVINNSQKLFNNGKN
jgi:hypothetical protein